MLLNKTINIPESFFGVEFFDVQIEITNESTEFLISEIAHAQLVKDSSYLGDEFHIPLDTLDVNSLEELVIQGIMEAIN